MRDEFPLGVRQKLAERAAFICSNPSCNKITIGPVENDLTKSTRIGVAAHICAAAPNGPRYDISQTLRERASITNGIWLCGSCSILIDKNNGIDYPADHLHRWKNDHEELMKKCLEGSKRLIFQFLNTPNDHSTIVHIVRFLEQRGVMFMPYKYEFPRYVFDSIKETRNFLTHIQTSVETGSKIDMIIDSMNHGLRHFMNTTSRDCTDQEMLYGLGAVRKLIGINLGIIEKDFGIIITGPLKDSIPN